MPYFCTRKKCGYFWDARGRTDKKVQCPKCRTTAILYARHGYVEDIKNFIRRRKRYLRTEPKQTARTFQNIENIPDEVGSLILTFCNKRKYNNTPEENITWIQKKGYSKKEAQELIQLLNSKFAPRKKKIPDYDKDQGPDEPPTEEPMSTSKKEGGRPPIKLKPGQIEYFHQKYREFKTIAAMQLQPDREPQVHHVREWFRHTGHKDSVLYRWALELLENHKPKEYKKGLLPDEPSQ